MVRISFAWAKVPNDDDTYRDLEHISDNTGSRVHDMIEKQRSENGSLLGEFHNKIEKGFKMWLPYL